MYAHHVSFVLYKRTGQHTTNSSVCVCRSPGYDSAVPLYLLQAEVVVFPLGEDPPLRLHLHAL